MTAQSLFPDILDPRAWDITVYPDYTQFPFRELPLVQMNYIQRVLRPIAIARVAKTHAPVYLYQVQSTGIALRDCPPDSEEARRLGYKVLFVIDQNTRPL